MTDLISRITNDRFDESHVSEPARHAPDLELAQRRSWNASSRHAESLIHAWINEARLEVALEEFAETPVMDLSLKHALTGGVE